MTPYECTSLCSRSDFTRRKSVRGPYNFPGRALPFIRRCGVFSQSGILALEQNIMKEGDHLRLKFRLTCDLGRVVLSLCYMASLSRPYSDACI